MTLMTAAAVAMTTGQLNLSSGAVCETVVLCCCSWLSCGWCSGQRLVLHSLMPCLTHMHACTHTRLCMRTRMLVRTHTHIHAHRNHAHVHIHTTYTHTHTHSHTLAHTHSHTHTHTHTQRYIHCCMSHLFISGKEICSECC